MRRNLLLTAVLALSVSGVVTATFSAPASAKAAKITCTTISGSVSSGINITGCTGGNTGGGALKQNAALLENGGTIKWESGSTTTLAKPTLTTVSAKKCPGYVKGGTTIVADKASVVVTADTGDGLAIPGVAAGVLCVNNSTLTVLSALKKLTLT